jgi:hypothetical protein
MAGAGVLAQVETTVVENYDKQVLAGLPKLTLPAGYRTKSLPYKKDNARPPYFAGIYSQEVWNCNQVASVWVMYTYEINILRGLESTQPENQYSPMAVFNLLNHGDPGIGVSYFDSWNLIKANGIPGHQDFPANNQNSQTWMTGYDRYYRGMKNRIDDVFSIYVGDPDGLLTLKHWLNDHLSGSQYGGMANFQIASDGMVHPQIPIGSGLEEEGQFIMLKYGTYVGHAMTIAGWNDSVRYDANGDGRYTNNIDINGDKTVDMKDWEIGAVLVVNTWGAGWCNGGKVWVPYRLLAQGPETGGIWEKTVMAVKPRQIYNPLLTTKVRIKYDLRNHIRIQAGVATDLNAKEPEYVIDFPCFNFQGGAFPMQGLVAPDNQNIEIGLDITPLLNYFPEGAPAKIFLEVIQKTTDNTGTGQVTYFSVMDYNNGSREIQGSGFPADIRRNGITRLSVVVDPDVARPLISTNELPEASPDEDYNFLLKATGSMGPFKWTDPSMLYQETESGQSVGFSGGEKILPDGDTKYITRDLPFTFRYYGKTFNQITILPGGGIIMGSYVVQYPYAIDKRLTVHQNCGLYPFHASLFYPTDDQKVTIQSSASEVVVRWMATLDQEALQPVEFAAKLTPDGKAVFFFGDMTVNPGTSWISALSAGDLMHSYLLKNNITGMVSNSSFVMEPVLWPEGLVLSEEGRLTGRVRHGGEWFLNFQAADVHGLTATKELYLYAAGGSAVRDHDNKNNVILYPNPVSGSSWLQIDAVQAGTVQFELINLSGQRVVQKSEPVKPGRNLIPVDETGNLDPGIYFYRINGIVSASGKLMVR